MTDRPYHEITVVGEAPEDGAVDALAALLDARAKIEAVRARTMRMTQILERTFGRRDPGDPVPGNS